MNNEQLCIGLRKGDKRVLDQIYTLYHEKIFGFARAYLKNEDDAYDIVQEVFIRIWEYRSDLKHDTRLEALIFTAAKNAIISLFRKKSTEKKYLEYLAQATLSNNIGTEELTDFDFLENQYKTLIAQLPDKRREVFILSRQQGLSHKEIAQKLGITEKTVENQLTKALAFLKDQFDKTGLLGALFFWLYVG